MSVSMQAVAVSLEAAIAHAKEAQARLSMYPNVKLAVRHMDIHLRPTREIAMNMLTAGRITQDQFDQIFDGLDPLTIVAECHANDRRP